MRKFGRAERVQIMKDAEALYMAERADEVPFEQLPETEKHGYVLRVPAPAAD